MQLASRGSCPFRFPCRPGGRPGGLPAGIRTAHRGYSIHSRGLLLFWLRRLWRILGRCAAGPAVAFHAGTCGRRCTSVFPKVQGECKCGWRRCHGGLCRLFLGWRACRAQWRVCRWVYGAHRSDLLRRMRLRERIRRRLAHTQSRVRVLRGRHAGQKNHVASGEHACAIARDHRGAQCFRCARRRARCRDLRCGRNCLLWSLGRTLRRGGEVRVFRVGTWRDGHGRRRRR
jgi:hypothetical protein